MKKERATLRETSNETPDAEGTSSPHHPRKRAATERPQHDLRAGYDALGRAGSCAARSGSDGRMHEDACSQRSSSAWRTPPSTPTFQGHVLDFNDCSLSQPSISRRCSGHQSQHRESSPKKKTRERVRPSPRVKLACIQLDNGMDVSSFSVADKTNLSPPCRGCSSPAVQPQTQSAKTREANEQLANLVAGNPERDGRASQHLAEPLTPQAWAHLPTQASLDHSNILQDTGHSTDNAERVGFEETGEAACEMRLNAALDSSDFRDAMSETREACDLTGQGREEKARAGASGELGHDICASLSYMSLSDESWSQSTKGGQETSDDWELLPRLLQTDEDEGTGSVGKIRLRAAGEPCQPCLIGDEDDTHGSQKRADGLHPTEDYGSAERFAAKGTGIGAGLEGMSAEEWFAAWDIPASVSRAYAECGVVELYDWQIECLQTTAALEAGRNLVYSAPTGAGKTLVAEVLAVRTLLHAGKRVLFVVPYVSIVIEKVDYFSRLYGQEGIPVQGYCSGAPPRGGLSNSMASWCTEGSSLPELSVCTIEKASALVTAMLADDANLDLGCVIVDEAHMLADRDRGYVLEILLAKLLYACGDSVQIIGLSATVPNLPDLARWLDADLYVSTFRPIPLSEYLVSNAKVHDSRGQVIRSLPAVSRSKVVDPDGLMSLCRQVLEQGKSVLVFCSTKKSCQHCALRIASTLGSLILPLISSENENGNGNHPLPELEPATAAKEDTRAEGTTGQSVVLDRHQVVKQLQLAPCGVDKALAKAVIAGVGFHHAGLTTEERMIVEGAFHTGTLSVLTATSTLAAGVNLPADVVIIRCPKVGADLLDICRYRQMVGRAGRAGKGLTGESYLFAAPNEFNNALGLIHSPIPPIHSCLDPGMAVGRGGGDTEQEALGLRRAIMDALDMGLASSLAELQRFVGCTFLAHTLTTSSAGIVPKGLERHVSAALQWLEASDMVVCLPAEDTGVPDDTLMMPASAETAADKSLARVKSCLASAVPTTSIEESRGRVYVSTQLGRAVVASNLSPDAALVVFHDLVAARHVGVLMEDDLHVIYLVTPLTPFAVPWMRLYEIYQALPPGLQAIAARVGVREGFLLRARTQPPSVSWAPASIAANRLNGKASDAIRSVQIHARFFAALMLRELLLESPLPDVSLKYHMPRGVVQQLHASAVCFTGMVASFCCKLNWWQLHALCVQFHSRLQSHAVSHTRVLPLMVIPSIKACWACALYNVGVKTLQLLAKCDCAFVAEVIRTSGAFQAKSSNPTSSCSRGVGNSGGNAGFDKMAQLRLQQANQVVAEAKEMVGRCSDGARNDIGATRACEKEVAASCKVLRPNGGNPDAPLGLGIEEDENERFEVIDLIASGNSCYMQRFLEFCQGKQEGGSSPTVCLACNLKDETAEGKTSSKFGGRVSSTVTGRKSLVGIAFFFRPFNSNIEDWTCGGEVYYWQIDREELQRCLQERKSPGKAKNATGSERESTIASLVTAAAVGLLANDLVTKVIFASKQVFSLLGNAGLEIFGPVADPLVAHWLLKCARGEKGTDPSSHASIKSGGETTSAGEIRLGHETISGLVRMHASHLVDSSVAHAVLPLIHKGRRGGKRVAGRVEKKIVECIKRVGAEAMCCGAVMQAMEELLRGLGSSKDASANGTETGAGLLRYFQEIEMPAVQTFARMERVGSIFVP